MNEKISYSRIGFLLTCFLFPGLIGTFASFAIPAPVVDEMHQEAALDLVLNAPDPAAQRAAIASLADDVDEDTAIRSFILCFQGRSLQVFGLMISPVSSVTAVSEVALRVESPGIYHWLSSHYLNATKFATTATRNATGKVVPS